MEKNEVGCIVVKTTRIRKVLYPQKGLKILHHQKFYEFRILFGIEVCNTELLAAKNPERIEEIGLRGGWKMKLTIETVLSQGGETMKQRMLADATRLRKDSGFVLSYVEEETNTRVKIEVNTTEATPQVTLHRQGDVRSQMDFHHTKATKGIYELGAGRQMHFEIRTKQVHLEETEEMVLLVLEYQLFQQKQLITSSLVTFQLQIKENV